MYKKWTVSIIALISCCFASAQQVDSVAKQAHYQAIYSRSLHYSDLSSAAYALQEYLQWGGNNRYEDTLALMYFRANNGAGAYKLASEIISRNSRNILALTLLSELSLQSGEVKKSLDWSEKLQAESPSASNLYQIALRQFVLARTGECKQNLQQVLMDSAESRAQKVILQIDNQQSETVSVMAAAFNMLGALAQKENDNPQARKYYQLALKEEPKCQVAAMNIKSLNGSDTPVKSVSKPVKR